MTSAPHLSVGRYDDQLDFRVAIDRVLQSEAIACHVSQSAWNPVPRRRLELSGKVEHPWLAHPVQITVPANDRTTSLQTSRAVSWLRPKPLVVLGRGDLQLGTTGGRCGNRAFVA